MRHFHLPIVVLAFLISSCADDLVIQGGLKLSVSETTMDDQRLDAVHFYVSRVDALSENGWRTLKVFAPSQGLNLLQYSGSNSFPLVDLMTDPGNFSALRFALNLAQFNTGLSQGPQCNLVFAGGNTQPIYFFTAGTTEITVPLHFGVRSQNQTDYTLDFDLRKSISQDSAGHYLYTPFVRTVETKKAGHIQVTVTNYAPENQLVVLAYPAGHYSGSEASAALPGGPLFANALTSARLVDNQAGLGFLPSGTYDLIFVLFDPVGGFLSVKGQFTGVAVAPGETTHPRINMSLLTGP